MYRKLDRLLRDVLGLTREEQEEVLSTILASLDQDETVDREWLVAVRRRFDRTRSHGNSQDGDEPAAQVGDRAADWEDPIVAEVHRVRQELLDEFGGDVDALMDEANRRLSNGKFGPRKIVSFPPSRPKQMPNRALG